MSSQLTARDMIDLPQVTLVAVSSIAIDATLQALRRSMQGIRFGAVIMLTDKARPAGWDDIEWKLIDPIRSRAEYSRFMLRDLADHIDTDYALCVQWDGFVLRPAAWQKSFLDFDYIGAPWPHFRDGRNVGNGGFSLRSRALLRASRELPFHSSLAEDVIICRLYREELESSGIRFASADVARLFAYERSAPQDNEFGFHGVFNLVRLLPDRELLPLFASLEQSVLAPRETTELAKWALSRGHSKLALTLLGRRLRRRGALS